MDPKPHNDRQTTAQRFRSAIPHILERWESRVRDEVPAAGREGRAAIRDSLPTLLSAIAEALRRGRIPARGRQAAVNKQHGQQLAELDVYSLAQVMQEYHLLRQTLFKQLEADSPLPPPDRDIILGMLDQALADAGGHFAGAHEQAARTPSGYPTPGRGDPSHEAQALAESIVDTMWEPLVVLDPDLRVVRANRSFYLKFQVSAGEAEGRLIYDLGEGEWNLPELRLLLTEILSENTAVNDFRIEHSFSGIGRRSLLLNARKLYPAGSTAELLLVAFQDVTDRVAVLEALLESGEEARRLAEELKQADAQKNQFLTTLAHEFRTPLAAISNAAHVLSRLELRDERTARQILTITRQTRNLGRLTEDLLDISRISRGRLELRMEPVALGPVVQAAAASSHPFIESRDQELSLSLPPEELYVEADPVRLEQVVTNLLNNAAKYTEQGGRIWVTVEKDEGIPKDEGGRMKDEEDPSNPQSAIRNPQSAIPSSFILHPSVVVRIRDTGIGIAPEVLPRVFDLFMQADPSHARSGGGLGVGLALVKRLVELHHGTVTAHSEGTGKGSEFVVRLPLAP
jgi:two-component system, chemotaxis family, CheB/CheR fusion protein